MSSTVSFSGKTILVTGGCGGLGLGIADAFYAAGANVAVADINNDLCQAFDASHDAERVISIQCDITKEENVFSLFKTVKDKFATIDVVVNSAGIMDRFDPVGTLDKGLWDRVIALNLTAPMLITKEAVSHMLDQNVEGSVINIGSIASTRGFSAGKLCDNMWSSKARDADGGEGAAYTASKHGLIGLTKNTAAFYADKKIRCNAVMPAGMRTNIGVAMAHGISHEGYGLFNQGVQMTMVEIAKVASVVTFLASDAATTISGACIAADEGWLAH